MHPQPISAIPEETARLARTILPEGNVFLQMRDLLGTLFEDEDFHDLFPRRGQPAEAPWRLALVTLMHYAEGLTDRQAADAVRTRIAWKYVLSLELTDTGFDFSVRIANFGVACSLMGLNVASSICCSLSVESEGGSRPTASSVPTQHRCWRPFFARSVGWSA